MQLFSSIPNWVEPRGFVFGWEPALLGNCLSSLANLVAFSLRTGTVVYYPNIDDYAAMFEEPQRSRSLFDPVGTASLEKMRDLRQHVTRLFEHGHDYYNENVATIGYGQLPAYSDAKNIVLMLPYIQEGIHNWPDDYRERLVSGFCSSGNGIIFPGAYWNQYTDMREVAPLGEQLRRHIGKLRPDGSAERVDAMSRDGGIKIAVHIRQGDFRNWHTGSYYFSLDQYKRVMSAISSSLSDRPHTFYVCSEVDLTAEPFEGLPVFYRRASGIDDFICMGTCDYLVGPPSTFATWSAFLGGAQRVILTQERIDAIDAIPALLDLAVRVPFPTGAYLPGDDRGSPI